MVKIEFSIYIAEKKFPKKMFEKKFKMAILGVSEILTVFAYSHHHFAKIFAYFRLK